MAKDKKELGMYGGTPRVQIGEFFICKQSDGKIWIETEEGEGAAFKEHLLESHIRTFFNRFF